MFLVWIGLCCLLITVPAQHMAISTADFNFTSSALCSFSASLYQSIAEAKIGGNVLISPLSAVTSLGMVHAGTKGRTEEQLKKALRLPQDNNKINNYFASLLHNSRGNENLTLAVANKIYVGLGVNLLDTFHNVMINSFKSAPENINFGAPDAYRLINKWVDEHTQNAIWDLVPDDGVGPSTTFSLANAVYFKANWLTQFKTEETKQKPFYLGVGHKSVNVSMMKIKGRFRHSSINDMDASILELPFSGRQMSLFIILPHERDGLATVELKFHRKTLEAIPQKMVPFHLDVEIPKFRVESSVNVVPIMKYIEVTELFKKKKTDPFEMLGDKGLAVSDVFHKTFIEVNEKGSEVAGSSMETDLFSKRNTNVSRIPGRDSAIGDVIHEIEIIVDEKGRKVDAATVLGRKTRYRLVPDMRKFIVEHPFLFFIRDNALNSILCVGRVMDPTK